MSDDRQLFTARPADVAALAAHFDAAKAGSPRTVRLRAVHGGGKRAVATDFLRGLPSEDSLVWRVACVDQENGLQWLIRMYGSLVATLSADPVRRTKVEMVLNTQVAAQPKRVQTWYQQFVSAMKESKTDRESGQIQLRLPTDNPLVGLVEVVIGISRKVPVILDLQGIWLAQSLAPATFLEALTDEAKSQGSKLLVLVHDEPDDAANEASWPVPLLDWYRRRSENLAQVAIAPWGASETATYLESRGLQGDAAGFAALASGRPAYLHELVDAFVADGRSLTDLAGVDLASLAPLNVDESELDAPAEPPAEGARKHATAADAGQAAYFAALLGHTFPSNLVADMGGWDRESMDDLIDAMPGLFEQVQFSNDLGSWLYKFKRGTMRDGILARHANDEGHDLARRVGLFMERFLAPRGTGFVLKTSRVYAEHGAAARASNLRAQVLAGDSPDVWALAHDGMRYFDEVPWPDPMRRIVLQNLLDRMIGAGSAPNQLEPLHKEVEAFAASRNDEELTAWALFAGSRMDARRGDAYRARERAKQSVEKYKALGNGARVGELFNHLGGIELQDGNPNAALDFTNQAVEAAKVKGPDGQEGVLPGVFATAEHIRGLVTRAARKLPEAVEHFRRANDVAGQAGLPAVALDAAVNYGEALLASEEFDQARTALERCVQIARGLRNPLRERTASELLAQVYGRQGAFDKALPAAQRALELSTAQKLEGALPFDNYHVGFFLMQLRKPSEALVFFKRSAERAGSLGNHPVVRELGYFKAIAHLQVGETQEGVTGLRDILPKLREAKDWRKAANVMENLATVEQKAGNVEAARKLLAEGEKLLDDAGLKDEAKAMRTKARQIEA